jgi:hypothetical protein
MAGGACMLFAGERAVRKVSKMESTVSLPASRFSFRLTARIQVIWNCLSFFRWRAYVPATFSAAIYRA